jgi:sterol desaturase/sphingolipid hydroxylase (fatty acid hydroxylase superfamily)
MLNYEPAIRLGAFAGALILLALWEALAQRRALRANKATRWGSNLALVAINTLAARLAAALGAVGIAVWAQSHDWGLFNVVQLPGWLELIFAFLLLDLAIYFQHVMFHAVPLFWRLHKVHHADPDVDVTTGLRFHTLEILLSLAIKAAVIVLLGAPPLAVLIFEMALNVSSMFNHSNIWMPRHLDAWLRWLVVTPDMHRIHHSTIRHESDSNYGFNLPWWDYVFGTYRRQPRDGHEAMELGLSDVPRERAVHLHWILVLPLLGARRTPSEASSAQRCRLEELHPVERA